MNLPESITTSVAFNTDSDGYFDRQCPAERCRFEFKIHEDDWKTRSLEDRVFCPACREMAKADQWQTEIQDEHVSATASHVASEVVGKAVADMFRKAARTFNHQTRNSLIRPRMTASLKPDRRTPPVPPEAAQLMRLRAMCDGCGCRYAFFGAAFFCPACGVNSAGRTFDQTLQTLRKGLDMEKELENLDPDFRQQLLLQWREQAVTGCVTAFQCAAEAAFESRTGKAPKKNLFQRLDDSSDEWEKLSGKSYAMLIGGPQLDELRVVFQKRHVLVHRQGIVDAEYISKSGDNTYKVDQRVVISTADAKRALDLIEGLVKGLKAS